MPFCGTISNLLIMTCPVSTPISLSTPILIPLLLKISLSLPLSPDMIIPMMKMITMMIMILMMMICTGSSGHDHPEPGEEDLWTTWGKIINEWDSHGKRKTPQVKVGY